MRLPRPAARAALLLGSAAFLLCGCGIPATGVVDSGGPASGLQWTTLIYFFSEHGNLVTRTRDSAEPVSVTTALMWVFQGPDPQPQQFEGLISELPALSGAPRVQSRGSAVTVSLPPDTPPLTRNGVTQVVCTAASAYLSAHPELSTAEVTVNGDDGWHASGSSKDCLL